MTWFTNWWETLTVLQQTLACVAIPATVVMLLQTVLLLFGLGSHGEADFDHDSDTDADHDFDHDYDHDHDDLVHDHSGLRLFTVRGMIAFFAVGGWVGLAMLDTGINTAVSLSVAVFAGLIALLLVALLFRSFARLQSNGVIDMRNAIGLEGRVYLPIPASNSGSGKVTLLIQERLSEYDAVTEQDSPIPTGTAVRVTDIRDGNTLVVALSPNKRYGAADMTADNIE